MCGRARVLHVWWCGIHVGVCMRCVYVVWCVRGECGMYVVWGNMGGHAYVFTHMHRNGRIQSRALCSTIDPHPALSDS